MGAGLVGGGAYRFFWRDGGPGGDGCLAAWVEPAGVMAAGPEPVEEVVLIAEAAPPDPAREFMRTSESQRADQAPDKPRYESNRDTRAAAELEAVPDGTAGAPSQDGIDVPVVEVVVRS